MLNLLLKKRQLAVLRQRLGTVARYGNEHHQSVAYASRLSIMLGRVQSVKELLNIYIIIIITSLLRELPFAYKKFFSGVAGMHVWPGCM
jgi:hypothetical protein